MVQLLKDGAVTQEYAYDAYGYINADEFGIQAPFYGYNGEEQNPFTGLQYLRARYYAPQNGGFITQDSFSGVLTNALSQNQYTYAHNNPVNYADPSGHSIWDSIKNGVTNAVNSVKNFVSNVANKVSSAVSSAVNAVKSAVTGTTTKTVANTSSPVKQSYTNTAVRKKASSAISKPSGSYSSGAAAAAAQSVTTRYSNSVVNGVIADSRIPFTNAAGETRLLPGHFADTRSAAQAFTRRGCAEGLKHISSQQGVEQRYAKARKFKEILVYYGDIWRDEEHEDMQYADKSKDELRSMPFISWMDFIYQTDAQYLASWRDLAKLTSVGDSDMSFILQDMISHFADGTGTDYTDPILTQKVEEHQVTQNYMRDFTEQFQKMLNWTGGDVKAFANGDTFKKLLQNNDVYFSSYAYGGGPLDKDTFSGLTMAIHGWTENTVKLTSYNQNGNEYSGTLQFTFSDNFGLDQADIVKDGFGAIPGFKSWYILQHYDKYEGRYQPFNVVVTVDYEFSGSIK